MIQTNDIKWLQVENTTKCNAWCPACGRNINGYGLNPKLVVEDLDTARFKEILELFPQLEVVQFCGTYGDFAAAGNVLEHLELAKQYSRKIQIHTHGGIRNKQWWTELAVILADIDHDVWFALDGLKGVHEIYRQGTDFDKTIANAQAFIAAGGFATWQFIPWAHNEHQIKACMKMSSNLGFKKFKFVKNVRKKFQGRHWQTGEPIEFIGWSKDKDFNRREEFFPIKNQVNESNCMHLSQPSVDLNQPSVYLNANGMLSSCCEFNTARQFDKFDNLPDIKNELSTTPNQTCLKACGSFAIIKNI
jgi:sulfatase maturation enzyme AslB (radical SAM superfamily)